MKNIITIATLTIMAACSNMEIKNKPTRNDKFFGVWSQESTEQCQIAQNEKNEMWLYPNGVLKKYLQAKGKSEIYIGTWEVNESKNELVLKMIEEWDTTSNFIETTYDLKEAIKSEKLNLEFIKARFYEKKTNSYLITPFKNVPKCEFKKITSIEN